MKRARARVPSCKNFFVLRLGLLGETGDCFGFAVVHVENRKQLGNLQHFLELAAEVRQLRDAPCDFAL